MPLFSNVETSLLVSTDSASSPEVYPSIVTSYQSQPILEAKIVVVCKSLTVSLAVMNFPSL